MTDVPDEPFGHLPEPVQMDAPHVEPQHVGPVVPPLNKSTEAQAKQPPWPGPDGRIPSANWPE